MAIPAATADWASGEFDDVSRNALGVFFFNPGPQVEHRHGDFGTGYYDDVWVQHHGSSPYKPQCGQNAAPECQSRSSDCELGAQPNQPNCRNAWNCLIVLGAVRPTATFVRVGFLGKHDTDLQRYPTDTRIDDPTQCQSSPVVIDDWNPRAREADERPYEEGGCCDNYRIIVEDQRIDVYSMMTGGFTFGPRPINANRSISQQTNGYPQLSWTDVVGFNTVWVPKEDAPEETECDQEEPDEELCEEIQVPIFGTRDSAITARLLEDVSADAFIACVTTAASAAADNATASSRGCQLDPNEYTASNEVVGLEEFFCWNNEFSLGCGGNQVGRWAPGTTQIRFRGLWATDLGSTGGNPATPTATPGLYLLCGNIVERNIITGELFLVADYVWFWYQDETLSHAALMADSKAYEFGAVTDSGVNGLCSP
ncbi:MAG TPA: hypothetical protein VM681_02710 [Candidatus Thermoplasmatota archaeon]|nr:hypothetical protein [Candidatus Thermoplasmatota archaeon]